MWRFNNTEICHLKWTKFVLVRNPGLKVFCDFTWSCKASLIKVKHCLETDIILISTKSCPILSKYGTYLLDPVQYFPYCLFWIRCKFSNLTLFINTILMIQWPSSLPNGSEPARSTRIRNSSQSVWKFNTVSNRSRIWSKQLIKRLVNIHRFQHRFRWQEL